MDWKEVIGALRAKGYRQPELAELCDCAQSTISDLATGKLKDPRDSLGQSLRALLAKPRKLAPKQKASA